MGSPKNLRKGCWNEEEDRLLRKYVGEYGEGNWKHIPTKAGLNRCRKSCRLRWLNYLRPNIKRGDFAVDEDDLIIRLHKLLGNRWSLIARRIPGRTANDIKNYWNSCLSKKISSQIKKTSSLETHTNDSSAMNLESSSDRKTEREWENDEEEEHEHEHNTSFWRSLLMEGAFLESNQLRVEKNEMEWFQDDDFFQGLGDLVEDMEILSGNGDSNVVF